MRSSGSFANKTGKKAERIVSCILTDNHYQFKRHYALCKSIYGHDLQVDFYLQNVQGFPNGLVIEVKWQDIAGSVDEKFPYLVLNIEQRFPCPAIIVIEGGGYKRGSLIWLKKQVGNKLLAVMNLAEFTTYINRKLGEPINLKTNYDGCLK
jgi:hypothetical protein